MKKLESNEKTILNRRSFLTYASLIGGAAMLPSIGKADNDHDWDDHHDDNDDGFRLTKGDKDIIIAAEIAEALAVTTYSNIINTSPFFGGLSSNDQIYLTAALQEEMSHYAVLKSLTNKPTPYTSFYYPAQMFTDQQTTMNILVTLEDAFIAAYLVGVRNFSNHQLRVSAARIMGIESDHRSLARVVAADLGLSSVTGAQGVAENVNPANNNGYERTLKWTNISQAVAALTPFVDATAAGKAGFDASVSYAFNPFTPTLPIALGDFISFGG
jgi:hypothetical protein